MPLPNTIPMTSQKSEPNERRWNRFHIQVRVRVSVTRPGGNVLVYGQGTDISEGGMGIFVPNELNTGETITIELMLPYSRDKLMLKAVVRSRNGFRYGIEYLWPSAYERELINRTCTALALLQ